MIIGAKDLVMKPNKKLENYLKRKRTQVQNKMYGFIVNFYVHSIFIFFYF